MLRTVRRLGLILSLLATSLHAEPHAVILMYHHVSADTPAITSVRPDAFEEQLDLLQAGGYEVLPLPRVIQALRDGSTLPERTVVITFDDAYRNVCTEAFPRLRDRGMTFTLFVNTGAIDQGLRSQCTWDQLRAMGAAGVTLANHSVSHAHMPASLEALGEKRWRERMRHEILHAERRIEEETGQAHRLFAYPYGEFNQALTALLDELGFIAFGQHSGAVGPGSDFLTLPRYPIGGAYADLDGLREKLNTRPLPVAKLERPDNPVPHGSRPEVVITLKEGDFRSRDLACFASGQGRIAVEWLDERRFRARAERPMPSGRSRYNCTMPSRQGGFHWLSIPWVSLDAKGLWPQD